MQEAHAFAVEESGRCAHMKHLLVLGLLIIWALVVACSSPPPITPLPDAGGPAVDSCIKYPVYAGASCDRKGKCPDSPNPCMPALCVAGNLCVLSDPGEGQPGKCGGDLWCRYLDADAGTGELGCCIEPPACIYDGNNCLLTGCPLASHPWCSPDGECCQ